ncbi:hypothetical protein ZK99_002077 [Salmonella enterica subsp. enterica]|uniref:Uncharacterized protein n=1 Tax=Salmonella enterica subsp. enterica serovar Kottbus TaxID=224727 RepID=A0A5J0S0X1_SALET|nr:hypothetical protein [Salmonella enterica subsp. enterica serovar Newport]EBQ9795175.1 hypothetical protein [Salmonella enterica subsp. enterica serovar Kottbus]EDE8443422.1 hypothetical protein [Salmonella enterica subsp. enterica serovar Pomona]EDJ1502137.1 hypothetical protein [Salmonella enterica]EDN4394329.1 hypothetical protein [Salmonella enterica subsp. enterica]
MTTITPIMTASGCVQFRHYMVTVHAIERYIERIGGDVGNLILDLKNAWVFDASKKNLPRPLCATVARCEREGGYGLCHDKAIFLVKPGKRQHVIVTTLSAEVK